MEKNEIFENLFVTRFNWHGVEWSLYYFVFVKEEAGVVCWPLGLRWFGSGSVCVSVCIYSNANREEKRESNTIYVYIWKQARSIRI